MREIRKTHISSPISIPAISNRVIILTAILVNVLAIGLIIVLLNTFNEKNIRNSALAELSDCSNLLVSKQLMGLQNVLTRITSNHELNRLLTDKGVVQSLEIEQHLGGIAAGSDSSIVYIMDKTGTVVACSRYGDNKTLLGNNYLFRKYYYEAMDGNEVLFAAVGVTTGKRGLYFSKPFIQKDDSKTTGVAVIKSGVEKLEEVLKTIENPSAVVSPSGVVFISNKSELLYKMVDKNDEKYIEKLHKSRQFASNTIIPIPSKLTIDKTEFTGENLMEVRFPLDISGWYLVQYRGVVFPYTRAVIYSSLSILLVVSCVILIISYRDRTIAREKLLQSQREAEKNLQEGYQNLKRIMSHVPVGVVLTDEELNIQWVNKTARTMLGDIPYDELRKQTMGRDIQFVGADGLQLSDYSTGKNLNNKEGVLTNAKNMEYQVLLNRTQFEAVHQPLVLHSLYDLSEYKKIEAELMHVSKMESIGRLAEGLAHEINTPAQFVGSNLEFIHDSIEDIFTAFTRLEGEVEDLTKIDPGVAKLIEKRLNGITAEADLEYLRQELPKALNESRGGVNRVAQLVQAMKEFSHSASAEMVATDLNAALQTTLMVSGAQWKPVTDIEVDLSEDLPMVFCDVGELNQVFLNLIVNSVQSIQKKRQESDHEGPGVVKISSYRENSNAVFVFEDNGTGIEESLQEKIFDPFFTTREVGSGSGQGLYITQNIVCQKHKGTITFDSRIGEGTTFYVRLPIEHTT